MQYDTQAPKQASTNKALIEVVACLSFLFALVLVVSSI